MLSRNHIIALSFLPGITASGLRAVVERGGTFDEICRTPTEHLAALGLRRSTIEALSNVEPYLKRANRQLQLAERSACRILHFWDSEYPEPLRQIYAPPIVIYIRGSLLEQDATAIAIVGTRGTTIYGRLSAKGYATEFAHSGITVVSGLARGVDQYAHVAAMQAGGRTIAVIASGLDEIVPTLSAQFAARIGKQGAVITEYPFGVKALPAYFPQRNRIISGLTSATVVVESDLRGGAMITASFALDQNRDVFAVPGPISSPKSRGTNALIRTDRARLTQTPEDVLEALGYRITLPETISNATTSRMLDLSAFEQQIYDALTTEPTHVDIISETTGMGASDLLVNLLTLEFKGLVRQMAGKMFLRSKVMF